MSISNHDKAGKGFDVDPTQLAHDLTILKMQHDQKLITNLNEKEYYDLYCSIFHNFKVIIDDKMRYDSSFKE